MYLTHSKNKAILWNALGKLNIHVDVDTFEKIMEEMELQIEIKTLDDLCLANRKVLQWFKNQVGQRDVVEPTTTGQIKDEPITNLEELMKEHMEQRKELTFPEQSLRGLETKSALSETTVTK
jgi:sulfite reductase beta subunit-like hemoprotein